MTKKQQEQLLQIVTPVLWDGERVELMTAARVGRPRRRKQFLVFAISSILTLGMLTLFVVAKSYFVVLTNKRLMFFYVQRSRSRLQAGPAMQLPRAHLTATKPRSRLAVTFRVTQRGEPPLKLAFGQPMRRDAMELASAIGVAA
ncbi:MAG: hypothetical protein WBH47_00955 [Streptosporangiaceae bacterium]